MLIIAYGLLTMLRLCNATNIILVGHGPGCQYLVDLIDQRGKQSTSSLSYLFILHSDQRNEICTSGCAGRRPLADTASQERI